MKKYLALLLCVFSTTALFAQTWVDTLYQIQTTSDISYGTAVDFAGNQRDLKLDISYPTNDTAPDCGRPLLIAIHGGAFIAGDKTEGGITRLREDFAKRGFTTAAINYRLGQFPTNQSAHCNTQAFGLEWDCMNMTDSSEWYRAYYRGIQDANGAIRYLVNHAADYNIDPNNIFLVGESAGGFIAMGAGFIDDASEVLNALTASKPNVAAPNSIYEAPCVQGYGYDTTIALMNLSRPDLGVYEGTLNYPAQTAYKIRGVGNFFGGAFNNIFGTLNGTPPALYLFHQPNDLIVPYNTNKVLAGFATCATQFPLNCAYIINRPNTTGSNGIATWITTMQNNSQTTPDYLFEHTNNNADCFAQAGNPSLSGHALDNYWLRSNNMAAFFAPKIEACGSVDLNQGLQKMKLKIYPNPISTGQTLILEADLKKGQLIGITDVLGKTVYQLTLNSETSRLEINLPSSLFSEGIYFLRVGEHCHKISIVK